MSPIFKTIVIVRGVHDEMYMEMRFVRMDGAEEVPGL